MVARGRKAIISRINRKLASDGKAVVKTHRNRASAANGEYCLLDSQLGTKQYLSLNELWHMARGLGLLVIGSQLPETVGIKKAGPEINKSQR